MSTSVRFVVDGFNVYHAIKESAGRAGPDCRWLDLRSLCSATLQLIDKSARTEQIHYYSALAHHLERKHPGTVARHQRYIDALEATGIAVHLGNFKPKDIRYHSDSCHVRLRRHEEKETDAAIAAMIVRAAAERECDALVLLSGDTDLVPAFREARGVRGELKLVSLFPPYRSNRAFDACSDAHFKISPRQLEAHQLPSVVVAADGRCIERPQEW
jgi:uncharacterized LabA/DUF88 family protein